MTFALMLVTALASFESTVVSTAMPTIIGDLGGLPLYAWVFSVYLLTATISMPVYGRLADIYGRRRLLLVAIGIFLVGAVACAFARSMPQLIVARAVQGLGTGGLMPVAMTAIADLYSLEERTRVQGLFSAVWGFASLVGPLLGAFLTVQLGWRSIFTINVPLALIGFFLVATRMIESRASLPDPVDVAGAALLAAGVTMVLLGVLQPAGSGGESPALRLAALVGGVATLGAFVRVQARRKHPLVPPELFRRWQTASPYLAGVVLGTTIFGVDTFVPLYVQGALGGSAGAAGAVVTPIVLCWALSAAAAARIILRLGFRRTARYGAIVVFVGLAALIGATLADAGIAWISAACAVVGLGLGPSSLSQVMAIQETVPERQRGVATSLVPFFRTVGGSIGVGALGGLLAGGLASRLGEAGMETASRLLTGPHAVAAGADPAVFRHAVEQSLLPVFAVLLGLAAFNFFVAAKFPEAGTAAEPPKVSEALV